METIDLNNKSCDKAKVEIDRMLADLVNSQEGLWKKVAALNRDADFCLIDSYRKRKLRELQVVEEALGGIERIEEIKALISSLPPVEAQRAATPSAV